MQKTVCTYDESYKKECREVYVLMRNHIKSVSNAMYVLRMNHILTIRCGRISPYDTFSSAVGPWREFSQTIKSVKHESGVELPIKFLF